LGLFLLNSFFPTPQLSKTNYGNRQAGVIVYPNGTVVSFDPQTGRSGPAIQRIDICQWGQITFVHPSDTNYTVSEDDNRGTLKKIKTVDTPMGPGDVFQVISYYNFWAKVQNDGRQQWIDVYVSKCLQKPALGVGTPQSSKSDNCGCKSQP
ncbi:MAG: hypothetical protein K2X29_05660, partial [Candidatus Obscuribacterales bacterium]|nr:hypothetical protein [Candidatus Obscuribacterales bacterium]